jgi:pantoate--beta-alanine ligase
MGALHEGHLSLVRRAHAESDLVVVTIFVNPTQFGPKEDLATYPRTFEQDLALCASENVKVVFSPAAAEMYPEGYQTTVDVSELTKSLCGPFRPGHFRGVATVVTQFFNLVGPCAAYFGEKDYQQLCVIRHLVRDLKMPITIASCPTVRDADGLAMSSRNVRLVPELRQKAARLYEGLRRVQARHHEKRSITADEAKQVLMEALVADEKKLDERIQIQYIELCTAKTLTPIAKTEREDAVVAVAIFFGDVRLIDNIWLKCP